MIDLYFAPTPNGHKITLFLEEAELDYRLIKVDLGKGGQFRPEFLRISPNNKIPAIVDHSPADGGEPLSLFESGAILLYLAEKTGLFLSHETRERAATLQWLFWQVGDWGRCLGKIIILITQPPKPFLTLLNVIRLKLSVFTMY